MRTRVLDLVWTANLHAAVLAHVDADHRMPEGWMPEGRMTEGRMTEGRMPEGRMPEGESGVNHPWMAEREHAGSPRVRVRVRLLSSRACFWNLCSTHDHIHTLYKTRI